MNLEAEYDNRAKVPEFPAILERWQKAAAEFRASHANAELDLPYGPSARQALDVFWPGSGRDGPLAIFVHGGYWRSLDRTNFSHVAAGLLAHGIGVAMPSYDLCPQVTLAALMDEVRAAAAFIARSHGRKMLALGHSAGGHLAATLLATDWTGFGLPAGTIAAALPVSGLFDLVPLTQTTVNDSIRLDEAEAKRLSPVQMKPQAGRLHAIVGGEEGVEYTRQSRSIAEAWGGTWEAVPGRNHFTILDLLADPGSAMVRMALDLLPEKAP
jgi:arylformamidase